MKRLLAILIPLLAFVGCGGGGGSSSSGPSSVGRYVGTADSALTFPQGPVRVRGSIQFVVSVDNTVSVGDPGQPPVGTGTLSGNTFTIVASGSFLNSPGVTCVGSVVFNGAISGATMSGTISSDALTCNGVRLSVTGTFTATLQAEVRVGITGGGVIETLRNAVRSQ